MFKATFEQAKDFKNYIKQFDFKCKWCCKSSDSLYEFEEHRRICRNEPKLCKICGGTFKNIKSLNTHKNTYHCRNTRLALACKDNVPTEREKGRESNYSLSGCSNGIPTSDDMLNCMNMLQGTTNTATTSGGAFLRQLSNSQNQSSKESLSEKLSTTSSFHGFPTDEDPKLPVCRKRKEPSAPTTTPPKKTDIKRAYESMHRSNEVYLSNNRIATSDDPSFIAPTTTSNTCTLNNDYFMGAEKQVKIYKDALEKICETFSPYAASEQDKEERIQKIRVFRLGQNLEEFSKDLPTDHILHHVLVKGGELEKSIASYIVDHELQTENEVTKKLKAILDSDVQEIASHKRTVSRYLQECNSIKKAYESVQHQSNENIALIARRNQLKLDHENCVAKLEKERDCCAEQMFDIIAQEEVIAYCIRDFVVEQKACFEKASKNIEVFLTEFNEIVEKYKTKRVFGIALEEHLNLTKREISFVLEMCVCCLIERGLCEEGLLRVGCAGAKLKRMKIAIDRQYISPPLPLEYQDVNVIGGILKLYLRALPEPLLTFRLYKNFISAAQRETEQERKYEIKKATNQLPKENYNNLRYLTRFLWCLLQKRDENKLSSRIIAVVMSPYMIWPEGLSGSQDHVDEKIIAYDAITIVEHLISDWAYFFHGEVNFFINFTRDSLFVESGANDNTRIGETGSSRK